MSSPEPSLTVNNEHLDANGHDEKLAVANDSPDEMSDDEHLPSHENGPLDSDASRGHEDDEGTVYEGDMDDEEEEEEEEEEPALKYERIGGALPDLLKKDSASALAISNKLLALGTHSGIVHILDVMGKRIKSFKPHQASVSDVCLDSTADFVATASIDGQVVLHTLSTTESFAFDKKRPMRSVAMEPGFAKRSTRAFVCGGMAGNLVLNEKGWLGYKETLLHSGEGPIWQVRWRETLIAWANDLGVKIYDTVSQSRITFIDRPADSPRADLFKCTLYWQDDSTLIIAWADHIKVARIRARPRTSAATAAANLPPLFVEITAVFQVDCMIAGIVPHPTRPGSTPSVFASSSLSPPPSAGVISPTPSPTSLLILAYSPPDISFLHGNEMTQDRSEQARKAAERPELRIISRAGEELTADALSLTGFQSWGCNDYVLADVGGEEDKTYVVLSPKDVVIVRPRDSRDHVAWLVEKKRYEEALEAVEKIGQHGVLIEDVDGPVDAKEIGQRYIKHLFIAGDFVKAARLCPKVCAQDAKRWEDWIFLFAQQSQLQAIIPYVPTEHPRLGHLVYEMMLADFLARDRHALLKTIKEWPKDIYDIAAVIVAVQSELDKTAPSSVSPSRTTPDTAILMECLAELYTANRQPGKALPFFLRLRRPNIFDLIRDNNLFTDVQDQALLLVEFDHELMDKRKKEGLAISEGHSDAITLLVDHIHSIPIGRVVQQLQSNSYYLFLYLDALFNKDPHLASNFADTQVKLYAEYATPRLIDFLRASNYYNLESAYHVCVERDLVLEMVFLLGRMGNNKKALTLIIERLGDVNRAIDFAKEQDDDDLWEDLLKYSETRPAFIRGLLENVGADIDPIRLIRRIKNGLEIPGLKEALIKILQDFHLQISLMEGCQEILSGDGGDLAKKLHGSQTGGFFITAKTICPICSLPLLSTPQSLILLFLCRHMVHAGCVKGGEELPYLPDSPLIGMGVEVGGVRGISGKIAFASTIRAKIKQGCPVCHKKGEGDRT